MENTVRTAAEEGLAAAAENCKTGQQARRRFEREDSWQASARLYGANGTQGASGTARPNYMRGRLRQLYGGTTIRRVTTTSLAEARGKVTRMTAEAATETVTANTVTVGNEVTVTIDGEQSTYRIGKEYGGTSTKDEVLRISEQSPLGKALLGKCEGDDFQYNAPTGTRSGHIDNIN